MAEATMKTAFDMNRFRRAERKMWREMTRLYREGGFFYRDPSGVSLFRKVPYPELHDFEIRQERPRREDRL